MSSKTVSSLSLTDHKVEIRTELRHAMHVSAQSCIPLSVCMVTAHWNVHTVHHQ